MSFEAYLKQKYGINEPIYVEDIEYNGYSRSWKFSQLKKLVDAGALKRFDTGIYYFPKMTFLGELSLDPRKIIKKRYISDKNNIYGYVAGLSLLNSAGLSTQCPNLLELVSNNETARVRDINVGFQKVRARKARTTIDKENVNALQLLDLMNMINPSNMDETERFMLSEYVKVSNVTQAQISQYSSFFPSKAMRNLVESGVVYELAQR